MHEVSALIPNIHRALESERPFEPFKGCERFTVEHPRADGWSGKGIIHANKLAAMAGRDNNRCPCCCTRRYNNQQTNQAHIPIANLRPDPHYSILGNGRQILNTKPGIAFIVLGTMGYRMLANVTKHADFDIVAAWDPNPQARDRIARLYPDVRIAGDAAKAISDERASTVYIASPPASHRQFAMMAARAGKNVFCERPLGIDVEESTQMVEAFAGMGVANAVNFPFAATRAVEWMRNELDSNGIGEVAGVEIRLHFSQWPRGWQEAAQWLLNREEGGFVREVASHYVYLVEKLFGRAELITSTVTHPQDDVSCETLVLAQLDCSGVPVSLVGGSGGVGPDVVQFTIWGTRKSCELRTWTQLYASGGGEWVRQLTDIPADRQDGCLDTLDDLKRLVLGEPHGLASFEDSISVQMIIEDILRPAPVN